MNQHLIDGMSALTSIQKDAFLKSVKEFCEDPSSEHEGTHEHYAEFDNKRMHALPNIASLIDDFLFQKIDLKVFKENSEVLCRQFPFWGFKNFSGQMQLNQYSNNIDDAKKEDLLRDCMQVPKNEREAKEKIDRLAYYLSQLKEKTDNPKSIPRIAQSYMLSYFWGIQAPHVWPIYYGSSKKALLDMGFQLDVMESPGDEYIAFVQIMKSLAAIIGDVDHWLKEYPIWKVEHVLYKHFMRLKGVSDEMFSKDKVEKKKKESPKTSSVTEATGEWIPPVIRDLEILALNQETGWTRAKGLKPDKAFETKLRYAFTLLGYETTELGQGHGREPDGVAVSLNVQGGDYAILYDAKAREAGFALGTSDREILDYILRKKEDLRRKRINKIYFTVVSSSFKDAENTVMLREIYRNTQVPVTLLKASDLLLIIDAKLQNVEIDHRILEDLFLDTGFITRQRVIDSLGI
jgi:hypothetical protein